MGLPIRLAVSIFSRFLERMKFSQPTYWQLCKGFMINPQLGGIRFGYAAYYPGKETAAADTNSSMGETNSRREEKDSQPLEMNSLK